MSPDDQGSTTEDASPGALSDLEKRVAALEQKKSPPDRQDDEKMQRRIESAVDARIARLVFQNGPGITVTGGNGNFTIALDPSALSMSGNGVCNADGTSTFTFKLTL